MFFLSLLGKGSSYLIEARCIKEIIIILPHPKVSITNLYWLIYTLNVFFNLPLVLLTI